jgi:hypothetical protein
MSEANKVSGRPKMTWPVAAGYGNVTIQNWMGDPRLSDFAMGYYSSAVQGFTYLPDKAATNGLIRAAADSYREKYRWLGANRLSPVIGGSAIGDQIDYGFEGYPVSVTSCGPGNVLTLPHGVSSIIPWDTRLSVLGSLHGACDGDYYVIDAPTENTLHVAYAYFPGSRPEWSGNATATAENGDTFTITQMKSPGGIWNNQASGPNSSGQTGCNLPNHRGQVFSLHTNVTAKGPTYDDLIMYLIPAPYGYNDCENNNNSTWIGQVPTTLSGTGGTAYIIPSQAYERGRNYPRTSDNGPRAPFAALIQPIVQGAAGVRIVAFDNGGYYDDPNTHDTTGIFRSNSTRDIQSGAHPRLDYGRSIISWYSNSMAALLVQRLAPCLLQPRGQAPDLGSLFETSVRLSSTFGNCLVAEMFSDGSLTRSIPLSSITVKDEPTIKYCAGWAGITVTMLSASTTSDTNSFDPDTCQIAVYVGARNALKWYSPPTISANLADVSNATKIVVQWSYSNIGLTAPQVTNLALPQTFDCGPGTCAVPVDRAIGLVYYKLVYLDNKGNVLAVSDIQTL